MKKLTKILAVLLVCVTVFSTASMAAEVNTTEETTTAVPEETTTAQEETTSAQEETTLPAEEETTVPETETTLPEDETTTTPEEETTQPEIVLPNTPTGLKVSGSNAKTCTLSWDYNKDADGYDVFLKVNGEWVLQETTKGTSGYIHDLLCYSEYEMGVRSFVLVGEEKYYSEDIATVIYNSPNEPSYTTIYSTKSYLGGIVFKWLTEAGVSGYILYRKVDGDWKRIATIHDSKAEEFDYKFTDVEIGKEYMFAIKTFVKGTKGTKYSKLRTITLSYSAIGKTSIEATKKTSSSITLEWDKVDGAVGYKLYKYNSEKKKYEALKTTSQLSYTATGLEASTKYRFRVRAYYKPDGKTKWATYSDSIAVYTDSKSVKASRVSKYKKYFTDGDWSVKSTGLYDEDYGTFDYTIAVRGNKIFARYDFKNNKFVRDFEYLIDADKEKVYVIFDDDKTYAILNDEDAYVAAYGVAVTAMLLDMSDAKGVKAKTTLHGGELAIEEYYTSKDLGIKKAYTFYKGKPVSLLVTYEDGSTETLWISKFNDTPSSSVFKIPSGYKKIKY